MLETLQAKDAGEAGLPSAASILSDKNYMMVWDIASQETLCLMAKKDIECLCLMLGIV